MEASLKVLLIGIDGGTFRAINPGIKAGILPTFKHLIETGVSGVLTSTIPPATIPAFPTLMTGMNSGKHGIFDFMGETEAGITLMDSTRIAGKTLWRLLSEHEKKCIVINVPLTFPPEEINGVIVSGMMTPLDRVFTYPKTLMRELNELTDGYPLHFNSLIADQKPNRFLPELHRMLEKRYAAIQFLIEKCNWNLFAILFRATDIISHHRWANHNEVLSIYKHVDKIIGELLDDHPDVHLFIFSDHGFGPYVKDFHVNIFLKSLGLLKVKEKDATTMSKEASERAKLNEVQKQRIPTILAKMGVYRSRLRNTIPTRFRNLLRKVVGPSVRRHILATHIEVDTKQSKAYFSSSLTTETQSITINTSTLEEYENLVTQLKSVFSRLTDPETGKRIVQEIYHRNEIYHGPFVEQSPDLILLLAEGYKATKTLSGNQIIEPLARMKGTHNISGVFFAKGPTIKRKYRIPKINLLDMVPTILHLLSTPIPNDVDGIVKKEIFLPDSSPALKEPQFYTAKYEKRATRKLSKDEEEKIKERLRGLGYID